MKMRPRLLMTATACTLAALLVLSNAAQAGTAVVCVGFDGHIDIETLLEGCCISGTSGDQSGNAGLVPATSGCGNCTDVQLKAPPLKSKESHLSHPDLDSGCILCSLCCSGGSEARSEGTADRMDLHSRSLAPLSTVVLLI
jgi:hypothetical protein